MSRGTAIEQEIINEAAILTGFGIGTAFASLVLLMIAIPLIRLLSARLPNGTAGPVSIAPQDVDGVTRDKALAAVVAVTALLVNRHPDDTRDN